MQRDREPHHGRRTGAAPAAGGVVVAFVSSLCCLGPLGLAALGVGVTGFWASAVGFMKALLPYRPLFIVAAILCFALSFYLVYRRPGGTCETGGVCARPAQTRATRRLLWTLAALALILIAAPYWLGL